MKDGRAATLTRMWVGREPVETIAAHFGVSKWTIYRWVDVYKLPERPNASQARVVDDPTPLQIAQRCAVIKAQHLAALRAETPDATQKRIARMNV